MEASSRGEIFSKGKLLLASFGGSKEKGNVSKESSRAAETLCSLINLLQTLQNSLSSETVPLEPSSPDWKILKALLELLVRIGISPHLSPGVGIRRGEQEKSFQSISVQLSGLFISNPLLQSYGAASVTDTTLLFICAETLSSFLWKASGHFPIPSSLPTAPASVHVEESSRTDTDVGNERMNDIGSPASSRGHSPDEKIPVIAMSRSIVMDKYIPDIKEFQLLQSTALIVLNYFLWDLIAAYSELSFGPRKTDEEIRQHGKLRIMHMIDYLPVDQVIEASFVLLNRHEPNPPPWMKAELGKQLSMLVTRSDGLVSILKELVGRVVKGNVESYEKVAAHLAKVPKSIATTEEYLKALCPQVLPLLLKHKPRELVMGEVSSAASNNVFHTAVSLACRLLLAEPRLGINYLVQPIMRPLLILNSIQANLHVHQTPKRAESEHVLGPVTENEVVDSLVQLGVLLTAGCQGSSTVRELILHEARIITSLLLELHFQLDSSNSLSHKGSPNNVNIQVCNEKDYGFKGKGIKKGFLHKGLSSSSSEDEIYKDESNLSKLQSSLADIVMAIVSQSIESALPCIVGFMPNHKVDVVRWPQDEGEVWEALQLKGFQTRSRVIYLSRLLLKVENWPVVLALMNRLLHDIMDSPWSQIRRGDTESQKAVELLRHMQDFEELNNEVGMKALESDICGAASLVKVLLENAVVLSDEVILELVLHMVHGILKGIRASIVGDSEMIPEHKAILAELLPLLQSVYADPSTDVKLKQMSFTLAGEVSVLSKIS